MKTQRAIILFGHGARDERWKEPFTKLVNLVSALAPEAIVELAFLELMSPTLSEAIEQLARQGCTAIEIIPVFLGQGGHIRKDFPELVAQCQQQFPKLKLSTKQAVGEDLGVLQAIAKYCAHQD